MKYLIILCLFLTTVVNAQNTKGVSKEELAEAEKLYSEMYASSTFKKLEVAMKTLTEKTYPGFFNEYGRLYTKQKGEEDVTSAIISKLKKEQPKTKFSSKQEAFKLIFSFVQIFRQLYNENQALFTMWYNATPKQRISIMQGRRGVMVPRLRSNQNK
ncbi:hypothetical protein [Flavobacterium coralii]|uniref:hypothetical protein n=1 Tax=Flavobacterium coralii TaxID=2838017 RepID=UPI000C44BE64|nr:hypothetical protein [Flavobacterium sp.]|tara:strand:- start:42457 stop:42927 length:471 start_codon:yes stop_codon:yes gene_type:complete